MGKQFKALQEFARDVDMRLTKIKNADGTTSYVLKDRSGEPVRIESDLSEVPETLAAYAGGHSYYADALGWYNETMGERD